MKTFATDQTTRRDFVRIGGAAAASLLLLTPGGVLAQEVKLKKKEPKESAEVKVSTTEDLMREHGLLRRIILIYGEALRRGRGEGEFPAKAVVDSAEIVRTFIEEYHEKLEEEHLFPLFRKVNKLTDLVDVLQKQHEAGHHVTAKILELSTAEKTKSSEDRRALGTAIREFTRMYNPHAAREDTILFPAFHWIVTPAEFDALGEKFEDRETELFGKGGFEKMVDKVAEIEKTLGIYDLAQFTPGTGA